MKEVQVLLAQGQHPHVVQGDVRDITPERFRNEDDVVVFRTGPNGARIEHQVPLRHDIGGRAREPHRSVEVGPNLIGVSCIQQEYNPLDKRLMKASD